MIRPTVVSISSLADAASVGVDLALQERTASSDPSFSASSLPDPGTMGYFPPSDPNYA